MKVSPLVLDALLKDETQRRYTKLSAKHTFHKSKNGSVYLGMVWQLVDHKDRDRMSVKQCNQKNYIGAGS